MNCISKLPILTILTFIITSTIFADLLDVSFDSSNCVILSEGSRQKVSIPLPAGWKDSLKNQKMAEDIRKSIEGFILYPFKFSAKLRKSQNQKERTSWHNENNGRPRRN